MTATLELTELQQKPSMQKWVKVLPAGRLFVQLSCLPPVCLQSGYSFLNERWEIAQQAVETLQPSAEAVRLTASQVVQMYQKPNSLNSGISPLTKNLDIQNELKQSQNLQSNLQNQIQNKQFENQEPNLQNSKQNLIEKIIQKEEFEIKQHVKSEADLDLEMQQLKQRVQQKIEAQKSLAESLGSDLVVNSGQQRIDKTNNQIQVESGRSESKSEKASRISANSSLKSKQSSKSDELIEKMLSSDVDILNSQKSSVNSRNKLIEEFQKIEDNSQKGKKSSYFQGLAKKVYTKIESSDSSESDV